MHYIPAIAVVLFLIAFALIGLACAFNPDWGMRHFGRSLRGGGELSRGWNRMQMSLPGLIFMGVAAYLLYALLR